jgi:peptide/nickel transport system permease protein
MTAVPGAADFLFVPPWKAFMRRYRTSKTGAAGAIVVVIVIFAAVAGPYISPHSPIDGEIVDKHQGPSLHHPLGTDFLGRDQLARVLYGARVSVFAAIGLMTVTILIALVVGLTAGYLGGAIDAILMRFVEMVLAFPSLMLALAVAGFLGPGLRNALIALGAVWWAGFARIIRGQVVEVRQRDFIESAVAIGATRPGIVLRHVLPNISSPVVVLATLDIGQAILALAGLSFLNLGIQPPNAEWGRMVFDAKPYLERQPMEMFVPGAAIAITVLGFNLVGDALRDALDPSSNRQRSIHN